MTDPLPDLPPFPHRLPRAVARRIRATARRPRRRTAVVPVICTFGAGAFLDVDPRRDRDHPFR
ncbi:hypothetical protein E4P40_08890 [Blastococcus sp. CT_GayMR20]|uniref:hypothetical protein n=1 Tax=Blastococcus sp. CT_GayMR20 TaxID=2559609 RepID=UPI001073E53B|nr:hypothetical protein [Blastococcus sp. CT_GayMR20]TFV89276.1 hypothetical protein E4P40_08785 [Blastococcus sp. CT_GayMR20]TFV89295.1 hypothetical protein E4P40_08890 [Blastococcus sp. CT_GayMR20]